VVRYRFRLGRPAIVRDGEVEIITWLCNKNIDDIELVKLVPGKQITIEKSMFKNKKAVVHDVVRNGLG
jgi:hypothetical protein